MIGLTSCSESTVYRLLKAQDLITSPAYILMQAGDKFEHPSQRVNELWQTDFTYFKIIGSGWYYLSTVLDDYSRFIVAWRLFTSKSASDVSATLDDALPDYPGRRTGPSMDSCVALPTIRRTDGTPPAPSM